MAGGFASFGFAAPSAEALGELAGELHPSAVGSGAAAERTARSAAARADKAQIAAAAELCFTYSSVPPAQQYSERAPSDGEGGAPPAALGQSMFDFSRSSLRDLGETRPLDQFGQPIEEAPPDPLGTLPAPASADCVAPQEAPHPPPAAIPHPGAAPPAAAPALLSDLAALESRVDRCAAALGELQSRGEDRRRPERTLRREQRLAAELQQYSGLAPGAEGGETCADCRLPCRGTPFCTVSGKQHPGPWGGAPARRAARRSQPGGDGADAAAGASGSPGAASAGAPSGALSAELGELLRLRREGGLTDAEFAEAKACVLAAARAQSPPRPETQGGADHSPSPQLAQTAPPPAAPQLFSEPEPLVLHPPPPPPQPPPPPPQPPPSRTAVRRASSAAASSRGGLHRPETDDALAELRRPLLSGARSDSRSSDSPMSQLPASLQGAHLPAERVGAASPQSPASAESPACGPDPEECPGSAVAGGDNQSTASGEQPSQSAAEGGGGGRPSEGGAEGGPQHVEAGSSAAPEAAPADTEGSKRCCTLM
eukprot:TRINITY_DN18165_c0_g1_i4.p2 TRINITY_DN18165_c0_g1~~TRINITY_DN18165_c0_g1_i4.p2  ORF type:complete len:542 (+),score=116.24 TRINITY_DN18165_c0_g1_i4:95-1720(+)